MMNNTCVLENLTLFDLPPAWVEKFHLQPGQRFTVQITPEDSSKSPQLLNRAERIALMRFIETQLQGKGSEDSEEWIRTIRDTRTISEPKPPAHLLQPKNPPRWMCYK